MDRGVHREVTLPIMLNYAVGAHRPKNGCGKSLAAGLGPPVTSFSAVESSVMKSMEGTRVNCTR